MAMKHQRILSLAAAAFSLSGLWARDVPGLPNSPGLNNGHGPAGSTQRAAACSPASAHEELDLNNVRARIENGGTLWEDRTFGRPAYEVPKTPDNSGPDALFAGALWMGGMSPDSIALRRPQHLVGLQRQGRCPHRDPGPAHRPRSARTGLRLQREQRDQQHDLLQLHGDQPWVADAHQHLFRPLRGWRLGLLQRRLHRL
jgi:hypothetical protein